MLVIVNAMRDEYYQMRTMNSTYSSPYEAYAHLQEALESLWNETTARYGTDAAYKNNLLRAAICVGAQTIAFIKEVC
jgi:hypothetical protein